MRNIPSGESSVMRRNAPQAAGLQVELLGQLLPLEGGGLGRVPAPAHLVFVEHDGREGGGELPVEHACESLVFVVEGTARIDAQHQESKHRVAVGRADREDDGFAAGVPEAFPVDALEQLLRQRAVPGVQQGRLPGAHGLAERRHEPLSAPLQVKLPRSGDVPIGHPDRTLKMTALERNGAFGRGGRAVRVIALANRVQQGKGDVAIVVVQTLQNETTELLDHLCLRGLFANLVDGLRPPLVDDLLGRLEGSVVEPQDALGTSVKRRKRPREEGLLQQAVSVDGQVVVLLAHADASARTLGKDGSDPRPTARQRGPRSRCP